MTIRDRVREWLGLSRTHRLVDENACALLDMRIHLKRIEALLAPKPQPSIAPQRIPLPTWDWETAQQHALKEFNDPKKGN